MLSESATAPSCLVVGVGGEAQIRREAGTGAQRCTKAMNRGTLPPDCPAIRRYCGIACYAFRLSTCSPERDKYRVILT